MMAGRFAQLRYRGLPAGLLALLLLLAVPPGGEAARVVRLAGREARLEYGARHRGDLFRDTLRFTPPGGGDAAPLGLLDAEVTCDCITAKLLPAGRGGLRRDLAFSFHVEPEEPDGRGEKILYVFTDDPALDVIRLRLVVDVLPGPGGAASGGDGGTGEVDTAGGSAEARAGGLTVGAEGSAGQEDVSPTPGATESHSPAPAALSGAGEKPLEVLFFYSPACQSCRRVKEQALPALRRRWDGAIRIEEIPTDEPGGFARLLAAREHYGGPERSSPFSFYIGESRVLGRGQLLERLNAAIGGALERGEVTFVPPAAGEGGTRRAAELFRSLSLWTVLLAGLLDGVNPCAFATIVFFLAMLAYAGGSRRQMLGVGIGFTAAVFIVYLLLGLGAFRALQALSAYRAVSRGIYAATLLLLVVLLLVSLRDTVAYYTGGRKTSGQWLQLSTANKQRIHAVMRRGLKSRSLFAGAVGIGALVSLFEAACTGQVYLPTIVLVLHEPALRANALFYLVLYNLLFITPLVVVFLLAYGGVASERFAAWSKRHFGATRIALSLLFLLLALLMGLEWVRL